jgi:predicted nucleotidyltransferase
MRLTPGQVEIIKRVVAETLGDRVGVYLFGSRTDDTRRGGDIDLLIEPAAPMDPDARLDAKLRILARLHRLLGERKIDLVFHQPEGQQTAFQRLARRQGIRL